ncbi:unnamed protein product [Calypogeia fissa]
MALALCISAPSFVLRRHQAKLGSIFPLWSGRVNFRCYRRCGIRCDSEETPGPVDAPKAAPESPRSPSWVHVEPVKDPYAGWAPLGSDDDGDRRAGLLKIAAGVALAFAFSLVTYAAYSRSGTKHAVVYSVTTLQEEEKPSQSDKSEDAHKLSVSDISSTPSSKDTKQKFDGENPQLEAVSASGLHQKETAPGQDSFPSKDVENNSDEEYALSTDFLSDPDLELSDEFGHADVEEVDNQLTSSSVEQEQPLIDGLNATSDVKEIDEVSIEDNSNLESSSSPSPASDLAEPSTEKSDVYDSSSQSTSEFNVLENEIVESSEIPVQFSGSAESIRGPEESNDAEAKHEAEPSAEPKEETFKVSASLVVPMEVADGVLELLGLDAEPDLGELDLSSPEPGQMKESPSVLETLSSSLGSESWQSESVEYFGIPAPSAPSAAAQASPGRVVVPARIDHEQEQAMAALQALKVIEAEVEAGGICTRREYARWLIAISGTLARSPAQKVFPAMYVESISELAFNDVVPEDPDFPYIQGLAEAGLISSNLSSHDSNEDSRSTDGAVFLPDSPLSRQDLVSWKVALDGHMVQAVDKQRLKAQTGYIDFEKINEDALPFLAKDLAAGERSVISTAFGFTRRFQPGKPVTRAQAAIALVSGEAADVVAEELTRVEAEDIADAAVVAELALEARAQKHLDEYFNTELKLEKDSRLLVEKQLEQVKSELDRMMKEREQQRVSLDSIQAAVQAEKDLLHRYRQDLDEQLQKLTAHEIEVRIERDRLESLRVEAEEGHQELADKKTEVEVEKRALILARIWAEDEAKKARAHAKLLEEARKRWAGQGIQVKVDKDLDEENIPSLGWKYSGQKTALNNFLQRPPVQDILDKAGNLKSRVVERVYQLLEAVRRALATVRQKIVESYQVAKEKGTKSLQDVGEKAHVAQRDTISAVSKKAQEVQDATKSTVVGVSANVTEGTKKLADGFRGEAQKLAGKFKS